MTLSDTGSTPEVKRVSLIDKFKDFSIAVARLTLNDI